MLPGAHCNKFLSTTRYMRPSLITSRSSPVKPPIGHSHVPVVLLGSSTGHMLCLFAVFLTTLGCAAAVLRFISAARILDMDYKYSFRAAATLFLQRSSSNVFRFILAAPVLDLESKYCFRAAATPFLRRSFNNRLRPSLLRFLARSTVLRSFWSCWNIALIPRVSWSRRWQA